METLELGKSTPRSITIQDIPESEIGKRALEIALAGSHPILFIYTTGGRAPDLVRVGKSMADEAGFPFHGLAVPTCLCGDFGSPFRPCSCKVSAIQKHQRRIGIRSVEFDMVVENFQPLDVTSLRGETAEDIMKRVMKARNFGHEIDDNLGSDGKMILKAWQGDFGTARTEYALRVAKTIAKLEGSVRIQLVHLIEAIQYQTLAYKFPGQPEVEERTEAK